MVLSPISLPHWLFFFEKERRSRNRSWKIISLLTSTGHKLYALCHKSLKDISSRIGYLIARKDSVLSTRTRNTIVSYWSQTSTEESLQIKPLQVREGDMHQRWANCELFQSENSPDLIKFNLIQTSTPHPQNFWKSLVRSSPDRPMQKEIFSFYLKRQRHYWSCFAFSQIWLVARICSWCAKIGLFQYTLRTLFAAYLD